jgi:hypothetical protein
LTDGQDGFPEACNRGDFQGYKEDERIRDGCPGVVGGSLAGDSANYRGIPGDLPKRLVADDTMGAGADTDLSTHPSSHG